MPTKKSDKNSQYKVISDLPESLPVLQSTLQGLEDLFAEFLMEINDEETSCNLPKSIDDKTS